MDLQLHRLLEASVLGAIIGAFLWSGLMWSNDVSEKRILVGRAQKAEILRRLDRIEVLLSAQKPQPGR